MPRRCTVCDHSERSEIDHALVAESTPNRRIAAQYGLSEAAVRRHADSHLPARLVKAHDAEEVAQADDLLAQVRGLRNKAVRILLRAEKEGDLRTALAGIREARACLELLLEVEGELDRRSVVNIFSQPQYLAIIGVLRDQFPDAAIAVSEALGQIGTGDVTDD